MGRSPGATAALGSTAKARAHFGVATRDVQPDEVKYRYGGNVSGLIRGHEPVTGNFSPKYVKKSSKADGMTSTQQFQAQRAREVANQYAASQKQSGAGGYGHHYDARAETFSKFQIPSKDMDMEAVNNNRYDSQILRSLADVDYAITDQHVYTRPRRNVCNDREVPFKWEADKESVKSTNHAVFVDHHVEDMPRKQWGAWHDPSLEFRDGSVREINSSQRLDFVNYGESEESLKTRAAAALARDRMKASSHVWEDPGFKSDWKSDYEASFYAKSRDNNPNNVAGYSRTKKVLNFSDGGDGSGMDPSHGFKRQLHSSSALRSTLTMDLVDGEVDDPKAVLRSTTQMDYTHKTNAIDGKYIAPLKRPTTPHVFVPDNREFLSEAQYQYMRVSAAEINKQAALQDTRSRQRAAQNARPGVDHAVVFGGDKTNYAPHGYSAFELAAHRKAPDADDDYEEVVVAKPWRDDDDLLTTFSSTGAAAAAVSQMSLPVMADYEQTHFPEKPQTATSRPRTSQQIRVERTSSRVEGSRVPILPASPQGVQLNSREEQSVERNVFDEAFDRAQEQLRSSSTDQGTQLQHPDLANSGDSSSNNSPVPQTFAQLQQQKEVMSVYVPKDKHRPSRFVRKAPRSRRGKKGAAVTPRPGSDSVKKIYLPGMQHDSSTVAPSVRLSYNVQQGLSYSSRPSSSSSANAFMRL
jgi:hypothetical protein